MRASSLSPREKELVEISHGFFVHSCAEQLGYMGVSLEGSHKECGREKIKIRKRVGEQQEREQETKRTIRRGSERGKEKERERA